MQIVEAFDPSESRAIFTTRDQAKASDAWFLDSDNTVRCFFEEVAFDEHGALRQPKALSINKIGHAMHDIDPVFERFFAPRPQLLVPGRALPAAAECASMEPGQDPKRMPSAPLDDPCNSRRIAAAVCRWTGKYGGRFSFRGDVFRGDLLEAAKPEMPSLSANEVVC